MMPGPLDPHMSVENRLRQLILALLSFGLVALGAELLAIGHYEDAWQLLPVGLLAVTVLSILVHVMGGRRRGLAVLQILLILMVASGALGIFLHYQANLSFQLDTNPDLKGWELFTRVLHAIAPPALAPGVMAQLGLLGLIYTYKHPARRGSAG
jgi:hypothetical protein